MSIAEVVGGGVGVSGLVREEEVKETTNRLKPSLRRLSRKSRFKLSTDGRMKRRRRKTPSARPFAISIPRPLPPPVRRMSFPDRSIVAGTVN